MYTVVTNTENMYTVVTSAGKDIANTFGYQSSKMYIVITSLYYIFLQDLKLLVA